MAITLATLANATAQEVFDQVVGHLAKQKKQATRDNNCVYRDDWGNKCAAGCLIGEGEYDEGLEQTNWRLLVEEKKVPEAHKDLIIRLQYIHDGFEPYRWPTVLEQLAQELGLTFDRARHMPSAWLDVCGQ